MNSMRMLLQVLLIIVTVSVSDDTLANIASCPTKELEVSTLPKFKQASASFRESYHQALREKAENEFECSLLALCKNIGPNRVAMFSVFIALDLKTQPGAIMRQLTLAFLILHVVLVAFIWVLFQFQ